MQPKTINEYANGTFITFNFFIDKTVNLHKCPIQISSPDLTSKAYTNLDLKLITLISEKLNFTPIVDLLGDFGYVMENGSAVGGWKKLNDNEADIMISFCYLKPQRAKFFGITTTYFFEDVIFSVPRTTVSSIEKLIKPFNFIVWTTLIVFLAIGFFVIVIVKHFTSVRIANFIFGSRNRHAYLNMFSVFIGMSQTILPNRNFSRFLLMNFIIFSLNIRTIYLGLFFKNIHLKLQHGNLKNLQEVFDKNLSFAMAEAMYVILDNETDLS